MALEGWGGAGAGGGDAGAREGAGCAPEGEPSRHRGHGARGGGRGGRPLDAAAREAQARRRTSPAIGRAVLWTVIGILAVSLVLAGAVWAWRRAAAVAPAPRREAWRATQGELGRALTLDLTDADPDDPSVERLVTEAGRRALVADPSLDHVDVRDRAGRVLGRVTRPGPLPGGPQLPAELWEPHAPRHHGPSPVPGAVADAPRGRVELSPEVAHAPLADRLELPAAVRAAVREPDRAVDVLRAILMVAGREVVVDGDLVLADDVAIAVVDPRRDPDRALTHGFLRIQATDRPRGLVLRLGFVDPAVVRRREAAAPHVRHVGPDALQRMADAVASGADPVAFAAGPATL
ncbi:hypothetical protein FTX61_01965 [Nitriliruptoraceae bacterium ZYF776]|nr:hypothetical protein [Profundirhabdus halotolerans]